MNRRELPAWPRRRLPWKMRFPPGNNSSRKASTKPTETNASPRPIRTTNPNQKLAMPKKQTIERAHRATREGKSPSTQAGEFVREEIEDIRAGKHGARSTKQAIAIGLSKARHAGVKLAPPRKGAASEEVQHKAERDLQKGRGKAHGKVSRKLSLATTRALKREIRAAASRGAL